MTDGDDTLGTTEVAAAADVSYRQLDYWARQGYLQPLGEGHGPGSQRSWPDSELQIAVLMRRLIDAGLTVARAAEVARALVEARAAGTISVGAETPVVEHLLGEGILLRVVAF